MDTNLQIKYEYYKLHRPAKQRALLNFDGRKPALSEVEWALSTEANERFTIQYYITKKLSKLGEK